MKKTTLQEVIEGLTLAQPIDSETSLCAEHDQLYIHIGEEVFLNQDKRFMELGWIPDGDGAYYHYV